MSTGEVSEHPNVAHVRSLQSDYLAQFVHSPPGEGLGVVYAAVNRVNGMMYVGKHEHGMSGLSVAASRWKAHFKDPGCRRFHNALIYYGAENFAWFVIDKDQESDIEELEAHWISEAGLNTLSPAGYNLVVHSRKNACSLETRELISNAAKRRFADPEVRSEVSKRATKIQNTTEHRKKMSEVKLKQHQVRWDAELASCNTAEEHVEVTKRQERSMKAAAWHKHCKDNGIARVRRGSAEHHALRRVAIETKRAAALQQCTTDKERTLLQKKHAALDHRAATRKRVGYRPS